MAEKRDYYEVLGVDKNATEDELKSAYRKKAKMWHPDLHPGDAEAEKNFKEVNEAYGVLSDKEKRQRYDRFGHAGVDPSYGGGATGGMLPKLTNCINALKEGVSRVHILDGRIPHCLLLEIFTNRGIGTAITADHAMEENA